MTRKTAVTKGRPAAVYAPGAIRTRTDREAALVDAFFRRHPEYEVLPREVALQIAATYLDEDDHEERERVAAEGVPVLPYLFDSYAVATDEEAAEFEYGSDYR